MRWVKLSRNLHRDLGYILFAMIIIYALSGIAINHIDDWNPDFVVKKEKINLNLPENTEAITFTNIEKQLEIKGLAKNFVSYDIASQGKVKLYFKNGSMLYNLSKQEGELEIAVRRPLFFEINMLHRNPGGLWTLISDIFAVGLIVISITGITMMKGKNSLSGRGKWLLAAGTLTPIIALLVIL